jgi:serine protease Do
VIGVTTAIITQGQAINLAVPANYLVPMMKQQTALSLEEFARVTADGEARTAGADDDVKIERKIPDHSTSMWDGCKQVDMEEVLRSISDAIAIGAPLYNKMTPEGFEACFRVYEGTAFKYEKDPPCKGVREAFVDGIGRARTMKSYKEKAWAMRDTFDGLINAFGRWCEADTACKQKFSRQRPPTP